MPDEPCAHIAAITTVRHPKRRECEECVKIGAQWVHLPTCQQCGTTQCCDDSPNRHASPHSFFFNDPATTEIYTLSLHDALPIYGTAWIPKASNTPACSNRETSHDIDRKSTRLNSSHPSISYAVFCLKKKNS